MMEKTQEIKEKLKDLGYFASEDLAKIILLFEAAGKRGKKSIPTLSLEGKSGVGKTFLAETFSQMIGADEKFVQCFPRMGTENFQYDVNIEGVMKQDAENAIKEGILLQTLKQSQKSPVVLVIDELDKARPEVDSFLLDFLENGRLTTGTDTFEKGEYPIYTFITSNNKRELDEALVNRSKKVEVPRPSKELFLEILGLSENHYLGYIYEKCSNFSIRQAKQYLEDLEVLGVDIDEDALSQYIDLEELTVMSLADLKNVSEAEKGNLEFEMPDLESCYITIDSGNQEGWAKVLEDGNKGSFKIHVDDNNQEKIYVNIDKVEQLKIASEYINFDAYYNRYSGWFKYSSSDEELKNDDIIWAENKNQKAKTRFGLKICGDKMFRLAISKENTFVYLDSASPNTLEAFYGTERDEIEENYDEDSEHDRYENEYDY